MIKLKEYKLSKDTFIGGWFIPNKICDDLIEHYNKNQNKIELGAVRSLVTGNVEVDEGIKSCQQLPIEHNNFDEEIGKYRFYLQECLLKYVKKFPSVHTSNDRFNIISDYNYQHYKPEQGFKEWHCERMGKYTGKRVLVFMTYLNDVDDGGTMFKNFKLVTPAKKGLTLIWPTDWPWEHKGQISKTKEKHIITGWYEFI